MQFVCLNKRFVCLRVEEKFQFFMNYNKWSQQFRNFHFEALITLKMLRFPGLCQWTLRGGSQLPMHPSYSGNSLSHVGDCHPKWFSRIVHDSGTSNSFLLGIYSNFKASEICCYKNSDLKRSSHLRFFIFLVVKFLLKSLEVTSHQVAHV